MLLIQKGLRCSDNVGVNTVLLKPPEGQTLPQEVHKYRLEELISVSLSTHIFTMNDQIRDGALMDTQDCSNSACHDCSVNFSQLHHGDTDDNVMHILEVGVGVVCVLPLTKTSEKK